METNNQFSLNRAQTRAIINYSTINRIILSRGTGKTTLLAFIMKEAGRTMPRSTSGIVGRTFLQILTRTLPGIMKGFDQLNLKHGVDYVVGEKPLNGWPKPMFHPTNDWRRFLTFRNGSGYYLISQERKGETRGFNLSSVIGDEGLNLKKEHWETEISVAVRVNESKFKKSPFNNTELIVSSQPILPEANWLLDPVAKIEEQAGINYKQTRHALAMLMLKMIDSENEDEINMLWKQIRELKNMLSRMKPIKEIIPITNQVISTYFQDGDIFDNIEHITWQYIRRQRLTMSEMMFLVEMLNMVLNFVEKEFYYGLGDHNFINFKDSDYSYLEAFGLDFERIKNAGCEADPYHDMNAPIDVSCDYGGSINTLTAGQTHGMEHRISTAEYCLYPESFAKVVEQFCQYYSKHQCKVINFWYDQTAIGKQGLVDYNFVDEFKKIATSKPYEWVVNDKYAGAAPSHQSKYLFYEIALNENDDRIPKLRFHPERCRYLYDSMKLTEAIQTRKGIEKNKAPEKNKNVDQRTAPHFGDALDMQYFHKFKHLQDEATTGYSPGVISN